MHIKNIENLLNEADQGGDVGSLSKNNEIKINPLHSKAYSEDLGQNALSGHSKALSGQGHDNSNGENSQKANKSIWMASTNTFPLFFYQSSKSPDKMEVVAEQLNETLNPEGDSTLPHI